MLIRLTVQGKVGDFFYLNPHVIESIRCIPDTVITLVSGKVVVVAEDYPTVYGRIMEYRRSLGACKNEE